MPRCARFLQSGAGLDPVLFAFNFPCQLDRTTEQAKLLRAGVVLPGVPEVRD